MWRAYHETQRGAARAPRGGRDGSRHRCTLTVTQVKSAIGTKPKHRGTLRALGLHGIGRPTPCPTGPEIRGMIARVPHLITRRRTVRRRSSMKVHDLKPAAGFDPAPAPGRARHRRQGRQDRRPGHQGPGRPRQRQARLRGRPAPAEAAHPEAEGLQEPVPGGVQRDQPRHAGRLRRRRGHARRPCAPPGLVHKHGLVKVLGRGELTRRVRRLRPRLLPARPWRPSRRPAAGSRCCPRRSATAGRRRRATPSPTADATRR